MSVAGVDDLMALRRRLFELVEWFGEAGRIWAAQERWRDAEQHPWDDDLWQKQVENEAERLREQLASRSPSPVFSPLLPNSSARALMLELEALDRAAWDLAGPTRNVPLQPFGSGDRARYVIRLGRERRPSTARQAGNLFTHLRFHALVPLQVTVPARPERIRVCPRTVVTGFQQLLDRGEVGLATTSFEDGATIEWDRGRATTIHEGDDRASRLLTTIRAATRDKIDLLVAPELTVTPEVRDWIVQQLRWSSKEPGAEVSLNRLPLVVPGSFHEQVGERVVHRAVVLDRVGNTLLEHHKLVPYGTLAKDTEDVQPGDMITVLVTPIGTVAIAICKDFCDNHVGTIWDHIQVEWLLVPAYGEGMSAHEKAADRIGRMVGTVTVLAHQGGPEKVPFQSFIHDATTRHDTQCNSPHFRSHKIKIFKAIQ